MNAIGERSKCENWRICFPGSRRRPDDTFGSEMHRFDSTESMDLVKYLDAHRAELAIRER